MWLESREGIGTTFFFRLPVDPPPPIEGSVSRWLSPHMQYKQRTRRSMAPVPTVRPRFVVLETGNSLQRLLTRYLDGAESVPVNSLQEAVQELSHVPARALLVNDVSVSEALRRFNEFAPLPRGIPAIICSVPGIHEAAGTLGVSDYLVKPISRDALLAALDGLELRGNTVLVVDDEPEALRLFRRMLVASERSYRVLSAIDGRQAMDILHKERPDAMLLDLIMPNMDGFQLLAAKGQDPALRDIPVVVISARDPAGQPIVSNALAVTQGGGLSMHRLLGCIETLSQMLSLTAQTDDPAPTERPFD